jgi:hypothetical protein
MGQMTMHPEWAFTVNNAEMLLILKALGGRLRPEDIEVAKELGDVLTRNRISELEHVTTHLRKSMGLNIE